MTRALIALGSNLSRGSLSSTVVIATALDLLESTASVNILWCSPLYQTPALPEGSGPDFVNAVAGAKSPLRPEALLAALHRVEEALGRVRQNRWGPRTIDLDLLAMNGRVLPSAAIERRWRELSPEEAARHVPDRLILPHPRMTERAFVLVPLAAMAPEWRHPVLDERADALADALPAEARLAVRRLALDPVVLRRAPVEVGKGSDVEDQLLEIRRSFGVPGVELRVLDHKGRVARRAVYRHLAAALAAAEDRFGSLGWQAPLADGMAEAERNA